MRKLLAAVVLLLAAMIARGNDDHLFPLPAELEPDVNFWLSIFTKYTTSEGVLHDNRRLDVVYERVAIPENGGRRARQRLRGTCARDC